MASKKEPPPPPPVIGGRRLIVVNNQKGGSGKTTTAVNLAYELTTYGLVVRGWDADPQTGSFSLWLPPKNPVGEGLLEVYRGNHKADDVTAETGIPGLYVIPSFPSMREVEQRRKAGDEMVLRSAVRDSTAPIDVEVIDSTHNQNAISLGAVAAVTKDPNGNDRAAEVIVPLKASELDLGGMTELLDTIEIARTHYSPGVAIRAIVIGEANPRAIYDTNVIDDFKAAYPDVFVTWVPSAMTLRRAIVEHLPHQLHVKSKKNIVNVQYRGLAQSFVDRWTAEAAA